MTVIGNRSKSELQSILTKYIETYVLCPTCGNPETTIEINKKKSSLTCDACGNTNNLS